MFLIELVEISKFEELNDGVIIEAVGRQRCKVINRTRAINGFVFPISSLISDYSFTIYVVDILIRDRMVQ